MPQPPDSICILRLSALGDASHTLPVVRAIQAEWPPSRIAWIIGRVERQLMAGVGGVEFIEFDKRGGFAAVSALRRQLKGRRFDVLLHMQVAARANFLSLLIRADRRIGWDRARSRDRHHWFARETIEAVPFQHQVQGFLAFARALGIEAREPRWALPVSDDARDWARSRIGGDSPVLLISPCSSHRLRNWPAERYAAVADHAASRMGMQVVLSGGPGEMEAEMGRHIEGAMSAPCLNLIGKDTLEQLKALLLRASIVISPDSGPAHIASALGTPVIGLYAATWSRRSGPYNSLELCVDRFPEAARKFRGKAPEALRWGSRIEEPAVMDLIEVDDVIASLERWREANRLESSPSTTPDSG